MKRFLPWRNIRSLQQMNPLQPLSCDLLQGRIDSSWTVSQVESSNWRHKMGWLFTNVPAFLATTKGLVLYSRNAHSFHSGMFLESRSGQAAGGPHGPTL